MCRTRTMTRMLQVASERSSSGCRRRKRTLILPSVMGTLVPLASSTMSVKQLYTWAQRGRGQPPEPWAEQGPQVVPS